MLRITALGCVLVAVTVTQIMASRIEKRGTCGVPVTLTQTQKDDIVAEHNKFRKGIVDATAMWLLTWNEEDAQIAQEWVNQCSTVSHGMQDACDGERLGQNGYKRSSSAVTDFPAAVNYWFQENENYTYATHSCIATCGHYTQVIWDKTTQVGCAAASCPGQTYPGRFYCNYRKPGNFGGVKPYTTGTPCSECSATAVQTGYKCVESKYCEACTTSSGGGCACKSPPDVCANGAWNTDTCKCDCPADWYGLTCHRSCTACANNEAAGWTDANCLIHIEKCQDALYVGFMKENCAGTCGLCDTPPVCP